MYKPPLNTNRVKTIKSKFENIDTNAQLSPEKVNNVPKNVRNNNNSNLSKSDGVITPLGKPPLSRQFSDPQKRNIKRTPAFRLDKTVESAPFQRNSATNRSTTFENKIKQFNSALKNCDNNNCVNYGKENKVSEKNVDIQNPRPSCSATKPVLFKSKSSVDFHSVRRKFNNSQNETDRNKEKIYENETFARENGKEAQSPEVPKVDLSLLYTEPIPKALRVKECDSSDKISVDTDIYSANTLKLSAVVDNTNVTGLTDTLKSALKRPLPAGPAPQKPPRTFQHSPPDKNFVKNPSFLHMMKDLENKLKVKPKTPTSSRKVDPKYMLSKLENALRNNKLRIKKSPRVELSATSGEDSDDNICKNKSTRTLPKLPDSAEHFTERTNTPFDLNCLGGCTQSNYEKLKEPMSSFFVGGLCEEPLYAEPFHHRNDQTNNKPCEQTKINRNSLYYMSSPVFNADENKNKMDPLLLKQISAESSSLSSYTSDMESNASSPMEDGSPIKIQNIIDIFETHNEIDRVESLKKTLRKTLDCSFSVDSTNEDVNGTVPDMIKKFQSYIKNVPRYSQPVISKNDSLFYCCLIVERSRDVAQIKYKFPSNVHVPQNIESLCFPETHLEATDIINSAQSYSLVITNDKGERMFGYCRRVIPEGSTTCLPLAYCILSKYRSPRFYNKILTELETRHGYPDKVRDQLIHQFYNQPFPRPGNSIKINLTGLEDTEKKISGIAKNDAMDLNSFVHVHKTGEYGCLNKKITDKIIIREHDVKNNCCVPSFIYENNEKTELLLTLHPNARYEATDLTILHSLPTDIILKIFSSLLLERKVIIIGSAISNLSSAVESLQSILYPFIWHHTFIPVLPESLWDIVESPTPVICGCLSADVVDDHHIENGIVVDLDKKLILQEEGDEDNILSKGMQKCWKRAVDLANSKIFAPKCQKAANSLDYVYSIFLSDAYLQVFTLCMRNYKQFIVNGEFQKEEFIKQGKTKGIRRFLHMFTDTFMFSAFVDSVLSNPNNFEDFDKRFDINGSADFLQKLLDWYR